MRSGSYILGLALIGLLALVCSPVSAQSYSQSPSGVQVDVGTFYDDLAPYGEWVEMPDYGWSWAPRVERGWRPYTRGQWVMTDDGWFWDSDEPFGWATYHYGRWVNDAYYGWVWVPGTEWAPAWVSWRHGNGYTGWAPLPPRATWRAHFGLSVGGLEIDAFIGADDYAFVQDRAFVDRGVYQQVLPLVQNVTIINVTNNVTNYTVANDRVFNGGVGVAIVERAVGRSVPRARTVDVDRANAPRNGRAGEIAIFRPEVRAAPERRPAQGRSLVKGEQPPPLLVERRRQLEQERQQQGSRPALPAKDVQQRGQPRDNAGTDASQPQTPRSGAKTEQQDAQRQRDQVRRDADQQRAREEDQQRSERERSQANDQQQRNQQRLNQERAQRESDAQAQAAKRTRDMEQQRAASQASDKAQARGQDQQRAQRDRDAQAEASQRAKDAQQAAKARAKDKPQTKPKDTPKDKPKEEGK
jgi:hypothetical protein